MRLLIQRVAHATVSVDGEQLGAIGRGLCVFVGIGPNDSAAQIAWALRKLTSLRIFPDDAGKMNRALDDLGSAGSGGGGSGGGMLLISQFTLFADARKGTRPSLTAAAPPAHAAEVFAELVRSARATYTAGPVAAGRFAADMQVSLLNDGPVTIWLDSDE